MKIWINLNFEKQNLFETKFIGQSFHGGDNWSREETCTGRGYSAHDFLIGGTIVVRTPGNIEKKAHLLVCGG